MGADTRPEGSVWGGHRTMAEDRKWPLLYADCDGMMRVESGETSGPTILRCDECAFMVGVMRSPRRSGDDDRAPRYANDPLLGAT